MTETWTQEDLAEYLEKYGTETAVTPLDELTDLETYLEVYGRKAKAKHSQQLGAEGEGVAERALEAYGVRMVEQITTPYVVTESREGGWVRIKRKAKVSGDRRGVMGDGTGRRVLAEVKSTSGDRILWSRLEDHQVRALDENNRLGAVSLLVVVSASRRLCYAGRWMAFCRAPASPSMMPSPSSGMANRSLRRAT